MTTLKPRLVFSEHYDIRLFGMEKLHPFDSCKYGRVWEELKSIFGNQLEGITHSVDREVSREELLLVHTHDYLHELESSLYIARALELPFVSAIPAMVLDSKILKSMRYAVRGTILATQEALIHGIGVNLAGGYHHASRGRGEGFCIYADIPIAIAELQRTNLLSPEDKILILDLDAHQGNGIERICKQSAFQNVFIFDVYNEDIYPGDIEAKKRINFNFPIQTNTADGVYTGIVMEYLPRVLKELGNVKLVFYNAGTDIFEHDPLGQLKVTENGVLSRDTFVFNTLMTANLPFIMTLSGGYTKQSYHLVSRSLRYLLERSGIEPE